MPTAIAKFIQIQSAVKKHAEQEGNTSLVTAISECILNVTGGSTSCPLGMRALEEHVEGGAIPREVASTRRVPGPKEQMDQITLLKRTNELLMRDETHAGHAEVASALESCSFYRESNPLCPMFALMHKNPAAQK